MEVPMKTERRWLKSALAAATQASQVTLPFQRGAKKRPAMLLPKPAAVAAR
jgi:hypothetical protein